MLKQPAGDHTAAKWQGRSLLQFPPIPGDAVLQVIGTHCIPGRWGSVLSPTRPLQPSHTLTAFRPCSFMAVVKLY